MTNSKVANGTVHNMPADLKKAILKDNKVYELWHDITPLARNEFICWVENAKFIETRQRRIKRTCEELLEGNRRPCCWMGCIHRKDKAVSPSVAGILAKKLKINN